MSSNNRPVQPQNGLSRSAEKQRAREFDQLLVEQGSASERDIAIKNDFFRSLDLRRFKISAIGQRHPR